MKLIKNKKGFTLIELLVAISIMGIIMIITLPQISNIQEKNKKTKYIKYEESLIASAKLYTDSYTEDMFGNNPTGCVNINYSELKDKQLVKDIKVDSTTCANSETFVRVRKAYDQYIYETAIKCEQGAGNVVYQTTLTGPCSIDEKPDFEGPNFILTQSNADWTKGIGEYATITLWDYYGLLENAKVKISWTKDGKKYKDPEIYDFRNKRNDGTSSSPLIQKIEVPQNETGRFVLTVTPVDVRDSLGNEQKETRQVTFLLDNTPPSIPEVMAYKWKDNDTKPTGPSGLKTYTSNTWINKYIYTEPSTAIDKHSGADYPEKIYYKYTTRGATTNESDKKATHRNIEIKGTSYIKYLSCDPLGNCSEYSTETIIKIDIDPPTCTVSGEGNKKWVNQDSNPPHRTIVAECTDNGGTDSTSGCTEATKKFSHKYNYNINTTTAGAKGDNNGGYVEDVAGNKTDCAKNQTVKVDLTDPTCGTIDVAGTPGNNGWYLTNVDITNTDGYDTKASVESGHKETYLIYSGIQKESLSIKGETKGKTVYLITKDEAGNICETEKEIKIDLTDPTCTVSGGSATWINKTSSPSYRRITATCEDTTRGSECVQETQYKDYSDDYVYTNKAGILGINQGGYVEDYSGRTTQCPANQTVKIDKVLPTCDSDNGVASWTNSSRSITVYCGDNHKCGQQTYSKSYTTSGTSISTDEITINDVAGNTRSCTVNVYVDKQAPSISGGSIGSVSGSDPAASIKTLPTAQDQKCTSPNGCSGLDEIRYIFKTSNSKPSKSDFNSAGTSTGYTRACGRTTYAWAAAVDNVGNISSVQSLGSSSDGANSYSGWSTCTKKCGGGTQTRTNSCALVTTGFSQSCGTEECCSKVTYKDGSTCSAGCGSGTYNRLAYSYYDNSIRCASSDEDEGGSSCKIVDCCTGSDKVYAGTSGWGTCDASCGTGTKTKENYYISSATGNNCPVEYVTDSCDAGECSHTHRFGSYITALSGTYLNYKCYTRTGTHTWDDCSCKSSHTQSAGDKYCKLVCVDCGHQDPRTWCPDDYGLLP